MKTTILRIIATLTGASKTLVDFILPILQSSASNLLSDLAPIALDVVKSLAEGQQTGAQKREAAVRQVQSLAMAEGVRASTNLVNLAVELAVQNLKSSR